jgi:hypothetical protein
MERARRSGEPEPQVIASGLQKLQRQRRGIRNDFSKENQQPLRS